MTAGGVTHTQGQAQFNQQIIPFAMNISGQSFIDFVQVLKTSDLPDFTTTTASN